jgi:hypothetical protein
VSRTISPVTQTADVAVNSAQSKDATSPLLEENGSIRRPVPIRMIAAKPMIII